MQRARRQTIIGLFMLLGMAGGQAAEEVPPGRQAELKYLLVQDCGSCHGLTFRGGLGSPLTPQALAGKDPQALRDTILNGLPGTAMPPWRPFVTPEEAAWMVQVLLKGEARGR
jgi:cytochrome c55X